MAKFFVPFFVSLGLLGSCADAAVKRNPNYHVATNEQLVIRQDNGNINFGVDAGNSFRAEHRVSGGNEVSGVYSWLKPNGQPGLIAYQSGVNGYQALPLSALNLNLPAFPSDMVAPAAAAKTYAAAQPREEDDMIIQPNPAFYNVQDQNGGSESGETDRPTGNSFAILIPEGEDIINENNENKRDFDKPGFIAEKNKQPAAAYPQYGYYNPYRYNNPSAFYYNQYHPYMRPQQQQQQYTQPSYYQPQYVKSSGYQQQQAQPSYTQPSFYQQQAQPSYHQPQYTMPSFYQQQPQIQPLKPSYAQQPYYTPSAYAAQPSKPEPSAKYYGAASLRNPLDNIRYYGAASPMGYATGEADEEDVSAPIAYAINSKGQLQAQFKPSPSNKIPIKPSPFGEDDILHVEAEGRNAPAQEDTQMSYSAGTFKQFADQFRN